MILRTLIVTLALTSCFIPNLSAGCDRGKNLIGTAGGAAGIPGVAGPAGAPGLAGAAGSQGIQGIPGIPSAPGILDFSDFYALMPPDNSLVVAAGSPVEFPQDGDSSGIIVRATDSSFILPAIGTYLVEFQVSVTSAAQLMLRLNGALVPTAVFGRQTGSDQIIGMALITTTVTSSVLEVINPPGNTPALIITPYAGTGADLTTPVSAHLTITRIQ
ncbi:MAG: collagen-like protein [Parachlamydiaceae bacterium]|nr:collagen-like protein [Parachlamydiaceae bacterium]